MNRAPLAQHKSPSPMNWERSPKPDFNALRPQAATHLHPSPQRTEDRSKDQVLVPTGGAEPTQDFLNMKFFREAAKDLPCNLPTTGRVVVRRFEEKDGEVGTWEQKEVVTRDGKIVKFDDIRIHKESRNSRRLRSTYTPVQSPIQHEVNKPKHISSSPTPALGCEAEEQLGTADRNFTDTVRKFPVQNKRHFSMLQKCTSFPRHRLWFAAPTGGTGRLLLPSLQSNLSRVERSEECRRAEYGHHNNNNNNNNNNSGPAMANASRGITL
ncbi:hypothetical protein EYF80_022074 [Liparis tanakae]|uniref:Uncharacterized protein n=1 Tax=Liparis tanakae TaxID=230148 RepID=A0A4Z2HPM0_9TELE|nr:hypothetical protein EYF80_022074 [Liparis tanakae]